MQPTEEQIQSWSIERLVPYAHNPRKNDSAVDRMCGSIRSSGFKIPCLVRDNGCGRPPSFEGRGEAWHDRSPRHAVRRSGHPLRIKRSGCW